MIGMDFIRSPAIHDNTHKLVPQNLNIVVSLKMDT
jgi:hypothetical protein